MASITISTSPSRTASPTLTLILMEAMKMETEIRSTASGVVSALAVKEGDAVQVGDALVEMSI
ncbi:MAG: biotin/lipoyl-binding protein, partial [gamma proteobacterium symbiont of Bathyaustriella thionipta]|nr:biotin/lipoyl-binding protein [gamma proteobacterium symbiont of Bathyaustriella thionipta]